MATSTGRRHRIIATVGAGLVLAGSLAACAGEPGTTTGGSPTSSSSADPSDGASQDETPSTASPSPSSTAVVVDLPTDCKAMLTAGVLAELADTPLNDPAFAPNGVQPNGTLICVWRSPGADTTGLMTTISKMSRGPALDMLNALADDEGFTCYTPDGGTRCEKTWENTTYPVTDGRTLFWRDDVLVDTAFSNLAPSGYTAAIVASVFG